VEGKEAAKMKTYEMIREIFNSCGNSRMRDVEVREIEAADVDVAVQEFLLGKDVRWKKHVKSDGVIAFDIESGAVSQRITFTELAGT
jgi:hypothetical protein